MKSIIMFSLLKKADLQTSFSGFIAGADFLDNPPSMALMSTSAAGSNSILAMSVSIRWSRYTCLPLTHSETKKGKSKYTSLNTLLNSR